MLAAFWQEYLEENKFDWENRKIRKILATKFSLLQISSVSNPQRMRFGCIFLVNLVLDWRSRNKNNKSISFYWLYKWDLFLIHLTHWNYTHMINAYLGTQTYALKMFTYLNCCFLFVFQGISIDLYRDHGDFVHECRDVYGPQIISYQRLTNASLHDFLDGMILAGHPHELKNVYNV